MQKVKIIYGANYIVLESRINTFLKDVSVPITSIQVHSATTEMGEQYFIAVILYED